MTEVRGRVANAGVATGPAFVLGSATVSRKPSSRTPDTEISRFEQAILRVQARLAELRENAAREIGSEAADILDVQRLMAGDPDYREAVLALVRENRLSAEAAVCRAGEQFAQTFAESGDECLTARAADIRDVANLLATTLAGTEQERVVTEPSVLVAEEIVPSELMRIDRRLVLATVSQRGSETSHASILARALGIPAVVNAAFDPLDVRSGVRTLVDGTGGRVIFDPDEQTLLAFSGCTAAQPTDRLAELVERYAGKLELCANISGPDDLVGGLPDAFAGVGLFRTEFLYLGRSDLPGEEEQYRVYRKTLERAGGRKVVVRTFDLGADKTAEALACEKEANPALGCRGIRLAFAHPDVFKVQLRALLRAAACGDLRIMYPLITSVDEVARIKAIVEAVAADLECAGISHRVPLQGVMVETPAAAFISDELAGMVDFLSIGTNDLTQYTLATDREGNGSSARCNAHHSAVLKLIRLTADHAHRAGIPVSICGELAADPALSDMFIALRIDALSLSSW